MALARSFGRCNVCEKAECEVDEGGYLFCPSCGSHEEPSGKFVPVRQAEGDYLSFARSFERCPHCGGRETTRETDDFLYCYGCRRVVVLPAPESWFPAGAICRLGVRCELRTAHFVPRLLTSKGRREVGDPGRTLGRASKAPPTPPAVPTRAAGERWSL